MPNLSCQATHCLEVHLFQIKKKLTTISEQQTQTLKETRTRHVKICTLNPKHRLHAYDGSQGFKFILKA